jgi:hypothetical protein
MAQPEIEWTLWSGWRGSPELLTHIARVLTTEVSDRTNSEPECKIAVHVGDDCEAFGSPHEFREYVTREALRKFSSLVLTAKDSDENVVASLHIVRKQHPDHEWLKSAVFLETVVKQPSGVHFNGLHDRLVSAVERGITNDNVLEIARSETAPKPVGSSEEPASRLPAEAMAEWSAKLRRRRWIAAPLFLLTAIPLVLIFQPWSVEGNGFQLEPFELVALALGGMVGLLPYLALIWLSPSFEVADQTRAARARQIMVGAIGPVIGVIGVASRLAG